MITAASLKRDLNGSLAMTPSVLETTIATQREQLRTHLHIADTARSQEDWETWATSARYVADITKALEENLEMQMRSSASVYEAPSESLITELEKRAKAGEADVAKLVAGLNKKLTKKEPARGRS